MKFAISSCWNAHRHDDGYALVRELADLGFRHVELSHGIRLSLIPGILKALEEGVVRVASLHNFCPLPVGVNGAAPNLYEPSAASRRERLLWLHHTLRTIDFARRVACDRVVLHSGRVRFLWRDPETLLNAARREPEDQRAAALEAARANGLKRLRRAKGAYLKRLHESYAALAERAADSGVRLGIENREGLCELPLDDELDAFLETLEPLGIFGYWHDTGHAQLKEHMGLARHAELLAAQRRRLLGFHLHDVSADNRDHQIPGTGLVDWDMVARQVQPGDVVVLEMSPRLQPEEIAVGREFLLNLIPALGSA